MKNDKKKNSSKMQDGRKNIAIKIKLFITKNEEDTCKTSDVYKLKCSN